MFMDTKINFIVKASGFPTGKIYKMYIWLNGHVENAGKYIDNNADIIKEALKDVCVVHSIEFSYITYTNIEHKKEKYGDIILEKEIEIKTKEKTKKSKIDNVPKKVTDISKVDLPNIDDADLRTLRGRIGMELFKRDHKLSDEVYNFYMMNSEKITVEEAKKMCEEHNGSVDLFLLKKREVRKKVEEKIKIK
jgi:hypothetical protein